MRKKRGYGKLYGYLFGTVASIILLLVISSYFPIQESLENFGLAGPLGAMFAGMLFVSSFTIVIGTFFIAALAEAMPLWQLVLIASLGSSLVDITLFHLVRNTVFEEMKPLMRKWRRRHFMKIIHSKYISWTVPFLGALIIISPLPDEIGVSMMGLSKIDTRRFALVSFALNCVGVFLVAVVARSIE